MNIERQYNGGFDVILNGETIDTVFYSRATVDEVRRGLIDHDGYDAGIEVVPPADGIVPLTDDQLESLCDDNEVSVEPDGRGRWVWACEDARGRAYGGSGESKRAAMLDAVEAMELDADLT